VLLSALYIVNQLLDEQPVEAVCAAQDEPAKPDSSESTPRKPHIDSTRASRSDQGLCESEEIPNTDSSPRDLP
jgi:hypothetical protein